MASTPPGRGGSSQQQPKYIQDFSKALANEVKILLAEVGKLRDEKRALQFEIAELMQIKAKHSAEGVYTGWQPPPPAAIEPPPPAEPAPPPAPAPGGWRVIHAPHVPRPRKQRQAQLALPPAAPTPAPAPPAANLPAWAQWRPNPLLAPGTAAGPPAPAVVPPPARSGLFGRMTPPPK
ncbi:hypothetical protein HMN09_00905700 [Mycena chlorophos]|uniref:Uncharacterized protein n=1 Tax=Mycena chlorophos TaxID=658473 RepID=A0A8H6SPB4_MYCCL|nr:hypothetical protein HMN09_00905700 [Mycena chlorophos]